MINFLHTYLPNSVLVQVGSLRIHWYGLFIALAMVAGLWLASRLARRYEIKPDAMYDAGLFAIIGGLVGARIYAVFLDLSYYLSYPLEIVAVWHGGLAIHGGIIGAVVVLLLYCYKKKLPFWRVTDVAAPALALGQAIGRWGNYFNQEIFGTPTTLPWGIPIASENRPSQFYTDTHFHPTFLYESFLNIINCLVLLLLRRWLRHPGQIFFLYLVNYSLIRIVMEQLRTDPAPIVAGVRLPILVSMIIMVCAAVAFSASRRGTWSRT
jgi:phosphatidylglycerol:prolipoprotein diacylglycerol transferase